MRIVSLMVTIALGAFGLQGCGGGGASIASSSYNPGYGPFDKNGNYVEAWADKPAKKHWWGRKATPKPAATTKKSPPLVAKATTKPSPAKSTGSTYSRAPGSVFGSTRTRTVASTRPAPKPAVSSTRPAPRPVASTPKPKPKPVASRPKPKPKPVKIKPKKPAPRRHLVKKGDTLYGLSRKYGTSVSAIQRANGLKGSTIVRGKTLTIPR